MAVKYGKFEMPSSSTIDQEMSTATFGRFIAGPFDPGFGQTIGNSLRRILLSALEAPAIISVSIEGVPHEYMAIDGIVEDMTNIILNCKGALLRKLPTDDDLHSRGHRIISYTLEVTQGDLDKNNGQYLVTLGEIVKEGTFEVINPELHLFTITKPMKKHFEFKVGFGRGYVPSERHIVRDKKIDEILVDSAFSPVRLVNYFVENTRVGQDTDYDRLILEVTTDGRITPTEALSFATQIALKHFEVFSKIKTHALVFEEGKGPSDSDRDELMEKLSLKINEIELSVRSTNCLEGANIETIAELVSIPERRMLEYRNFGKKSLHEIKEKLTEMGLGLGMDLTPFGITPENVKDKMRQYSEEKKKKRENVKYEEKEQ